MAKFRKDIQGLRAIAIFAVLFYHIWPNTFPNGFLGVDIFFVISGYLIAKCLSTGLQFNSTNICSIISTFYAKRTKRIVPIYLVMIVATILIGRQLMLQSDYEQIQHDMFWALGFSSNMQTIFERQDYFAEVFSYRPFLHAWSLGVEIQFYLISPFLMFIVWRVKQTFLRATFCWTILIASFLFQFLAKIYMRPAISFGLLPCRLWQFLAGILVFEFEMDCSECQHLPKINSIKDYNNNIGLFEKMSINGNGFILHSEEKFGKVQKKRVDLFPHFLILLLLFLLFFPVKIDNLLLNIFAVVFASVLIHLNGKTTNHSAQWIFSNAFSQKIGDSSYMLYLVHWPVIVLSKYLDINGQFGLEAGLFIIFLSIVIAWTFDVFVDSNIRRMQSFGQLLFFIVILYQFCLLTTIFPIQCRYNSKIQVEDINSTKFVMNDLMNSSKGSQHPKLIDSLSLHDKIRMNELMHTLTWEDRYKIYPGEVKMDQFGQYLNGNVLEEFFGKIVERRRRGNGNLTILLVGNSHAALFSREIEDELKEKYKEFYTFSVSACMPIALPRHLTIANVKEFEKEIPFEPCQHFANLVKKAVELIKPEVLFMSFRWYGGLREIPFLSAKDDELLNLLKISLNEFQRHVRSRIFFPAPTLLFKHNTAKEMARHLWLGKSLDDLHGSYKEHLHLNRWSYQRVNHLNCSKCIIYDLAKHYCDKITDKCKAFDEPIQLAYFLDKHHPSYLGRQWLRSFFRKML